MVQARKYAWKEVSFVVQLRANVRAKSKSAAELRAEAAERRLAALNPKQEPEEEEEDELVSKEDEKPSVFLDDTDGSDDDDIEVIDPHLSIKERKKQLESEMTSDERSGLKGDWWQEVKDLLSPDVPRSSRQTPFWEQDSSEDNTDAYEPPRPSATKRKAATESASPRSPKKASVTAAPTPNFSAANIVREERLRALGLSATSSGSTAHTLGGSGEGRGRTSGAASRTALNDVGRSSKPPSPGKVKAVKLENGAQGWQCHVCTYINHADQGRCGEWR